MDTVRLAPQFTPMICAIPRAFYSTPKSQLLEVLKQELKVSNTIPNELDSVYKDFIKNSGFEVIEKEGKSNVQLVKKDEEENNIRIFFDIDEVTDIPVSESASEEADMEDELESLDSLLCNVRVIVEKPGQDKGLLLNLFLQSSEASFLVDFVNYQDNISEFINDSVLKKNEFVDKFRYQGPRFSDLDESVQTAFENYLQSKGVNDELAEFIISFSEYKEEKEYRNWLTTLANFLS